MVADAEALDGRAPLREVDPEQQSGFRGSFSGFERDRLFHNLDGSGQGFVEAGYVTGFDPDHDGRAVAPVDIDGDGDLDLAILTLRGPRLVENVSPGARFVRLRLTATRTPWQALGAIVELTAAGVTRRDFVKITDGFQTQVPLDLHFGLGSAKIVDELVVHWPSGDTGRWTRLPIDRMLLVREGQRKVESRELRRWPDETRPRTGPDPSPAIAARRLDGDRSPLASGRRPSVVNFWAPWCEPCNDELPRLAELAVEYETLVDVVGVSVERDDLSSVRSSVRHHGLTYAQFVVDDELLKAFFGVDGQAVVPSTYVFDAAGELRRIFRGAVSRQELGALLASFDDEPLFEADLFALARRAFRLQRYEEAARFYEKLAELDRESAIPLYDLGVARVRLEQFDLALEAFRQAVARQPTHAPSRFNLGVSLLHAGRAAEAIEPFQAYVRLVGETPEGLLQLGIAAVDANRNDVALDALSRAVDADPHSVQAWWIKARFHGRLGQIDDARRCYERVLQLDPEHFGARREIEDLPQRSP